MRILRKRYRCVKTMAAWNEADHKLHPTYRHPRRAAQLHNVMREECRGRRFAAADVVDSTTCCRG